MDVQRGWALRPLPVSEVNEMVEMINDFMDMLVHSTITGICLAFWIIALMGIWKWFLGVMKRALFYLFPGLKTWADKRRKKAVRTLCHHPLIKSFLRCHISKERSALVWY